MMMFRLFLLFFCLVLFPPVSAAAAQSFPAPKRPFQQKITISFDLSQNLLHGQSVITVLPDAALHLSCAGLEQVSAAIDGRRTALAADKTLSLPPAPQQRKITIFWQLAANPAAGILISKDGISLTGAWHPIADEDMLFSLSAALPAGFTAISEGNEIESGTGQYARRVTAHRVSLKNTGAWHHNWIKL
jgi:hypothetical protein